MMTSGRRRWSGLVVSLAAALLVLVAAPPAARSASEEIAVTLDQAKLVKLPERVASLVIGNPLIADATLQISKTMVITGKGYGTTNIMALDRSGEVVFERTIRVGAPTDTVVVYFGVARQTYSCAPLCQSRITLGDAEANFNLTLGQAVARNTQTQGAAR